MAKCADIEEKLADYIDGALPARERVAFEAHFGVCEQCASTVRDLRHAVELVRGLEPVDVPSAFRVNLRRRLRSLPPPRPLPFWRRLGVVGIGVPATVAAGLIGFAVFTFAAPSGVATPRSTPPAAVSAEPSDVQVQEPGPVVGNPQSPVTAPSQNTSGSTGPSRPPASGATTGGGPTGSTKGAPKPPVAQPVLPGGGNVAGIGEVPSDVVISSQLPVPHHTYNASATATVSDPKAAVRSLNAWLQSIGGSLKQSGDGSSVTVSLPSQYWGAAIARLKGLGNPVSIDNEEPVDATATYSAKWTEYQTEKARQQGFKQELQNTTDVGRQTQLKSTLSSMDQDLAKMEMELKLLEYANSTGFIQLTLVGASPTTDTYTAAPATAHG